MEIASLVTWLAGLLGVVLVGCAALEAIEFVELLIWGRASDTLPPRRGATKPFVSFHVPICSEPPDVVARTLMALRDLDYDAFEVLVVDNNTKDERLWQPVEQLCRELNARFRFFHLPVWPGFKAGALNFALRNTAPQASLIGVIDADYESASNYLTDIVGYFEDENVAFVQTPQDYRNWPLGDFFRMCRWEYWQVFAVSMVLRNRRNAILMHGTMSLVRKEALERAGGWAEWCLTEDSELGLRILAQGHNGIYVAKTYGRGLLPFTYHDYKRQRRRWVIGGVQQLKRHLVFFLPWPRAACRLTNVQKLHYLQGWLPWFRDGVVVASVPLSLAAGVAVLSGFTSPDALFWLGIGMMCVILQFLLRHVIIYGVYLSLPWRDAVGSSIANCSLSWAVGCGWLAGLTKAHQVFQRTPKRRQASTGWLAAARDELIVGASMLLLGLMIASRFGLSGWSTVVALWSYTALFMPAVWMARLASLCTTK
jgi:hypothetical protein